MKKEIQSILDDLYKIDPKLEKQESELVTLIGKLLEVKPNTILDAQFADQLRRSLANKAHEMKSKKPSFVTLLFTLGGVGVTAVLIIAGVLHYDGFTENQILRAPSLKTLTNSSGDLYLYDSTTETGNDDSAIEIEIEPLSEKLPTHDALTPEPMMEADTEPTEEPMGGSLPPTMEPIELEEVDGDDEMRKGEIVPSSGGGGLESHEYDIPMEAEAYEMAMDEEEGEEEEIWRGEEVGEEVISVEITKKPNLTLPKDIDETQIRRYFDLNGTLIALVQRTSSNFWLKVPEGFITTFGGLLIGNTETGTWEKLLEIKDSQNPTHKNNPYHLWSESGKIMLSVVDQNGGGSGEGIMKLFTTKDLKQWIMEGCYYFGANYRGPEDDGDGFIFSKYLNKHQSHTGKDCDNVKLVQY